MDKYDEAIKYLTKNPSKIRDAWNDPYSKSGGDLFGYVTLDGLNRSVESMCGCLTQIRGDATYESGFGPSVTKKIREDSRIPLDGMDITAEDLPVFAEWQRKFDAIRSNRSAEHIEET